MSKLDSKKVNEIFLYCLFNSGEDTSIHVVGEGVKLRAGFHPERLKEKESTISEMLGELPEIFHSGFPFSEMCYDKNGNQWSSLHKIMDELVVLGSACKKVEVDKSINNVGYQFF